MSKSLKLEFSNAADCGRVYHLLNPAIKNMTDPENYVAERQKALFLETIDHGCVSFLSDENGEIQALAALFHLHEAKSSDAETCNGQHTYSEMGSAMARMTGFRSAHLVIAALGLKEWWQHPPHEMVAGEIKDSNSASLKIHTGLGWEPLLDRDHVERLHYASNETLANDNEKLPLPPAGSEKSHWYKMGDIAIATQARVLLEFMKQGGLINNKTSHNIPVDFSALDDVGMTRPRLEAIAKGEKDKHFLLGL